MKRTAGWLAAALGALPLATAAQQRAEVPYLSGRVVDHAEILKPETGAGFPKRCARTSARPPTRSRC